MTATTRLSSKGQVVIPARLRRALGWRPGERLTVEVPAANAQTLVLSRRGADEADALVAQGYAWFAEGQRDLVADLHEARRRARARERRRR